jgi:hypothetical protein
MDRIKFYKMSTDNGGAPCVHDKTLSLAICKPLIRQTAKAGDIILGFGGKDLDEKLIYLAQVTDVVRNGEYYSDSSGYTDRPDCIYEWVGGHLEHRDDARFHRPQDRDHDVGTKGRHTSRANVILCERFVYFGRKAHSSYKSTYPEIKAAIEKLTQGHRVNHSKKLERALIGLTNATFSAHRPPSILGRPNHADRTRSCGTCEGKIGTIPRKSC